ncbi:putative pH-response regulator protein palC [Butyriboletus roseoflavus]|nr:putative pH-response regulator protein palC [Butyriboletus roseoflavus]
MTYVYHLPTTGTISFSDFALDTTDENAYTSPIAETTQARANMRGVLKQSRRTDSEHRDYLRIIKLLDNYIPYLRAIIACVQSGELHLMHEPVFSWRTTLSATLFNTSPRLRLPSLQADLASTLLTYAMALSNFSHSAITSLGAYEHDRAISEKERKEKDERLNFGVTLLCRASGVFSMISEVVLGELEVASGGAGGWARPPDLWKEVNAALAKMALADAQSLAIRKLLSKAAFESTLSPGPPLPKSHPSTALIAKLHLDCASLYSSARTLAMTSSKSSLTSGLKAGFGSASKSQSDSVGGSGEVSADLLKYLEKENKFHTAIAHKWLGVDAGETAKPGKGGEAVGFLKWAEQELEDLHTHTPRLSKGLGAKNRDQDGKRQDRKAKVEKELKSVKVFLEHYRKINDSLTFDPVPKQSELQALVPEGRMAVTAKLYVLPDPAFGPGSNGYQVRSRSRNRIQEDETLGIEALRINSRANDSRHGMAGDDSSDDDNNTQGSIAMRTYIGAGSYF